MNAELWFHRGKFAASTGQPRQLVDCRISAPHRAAWFRGWDWHQARQQPATPEETQEWNAGLASVLETLRAES